MASTTPERSENPLIKALPPASDYLTYLTIIEYNLSLENLAILHDVLQDEALTTNIGWDLVHLLVPLLPDSEKCLSAIARLGNPREVILKVTESLRLIDYEGLLDEADEHAELSVNTGGDARSRADSSTYPLKTAPAQASGSGQATQMVEVPPPLPLPVNQFIALLHMLSILHARVKTKYPSRFLSTTLQAILASFSNAPSHREEMIRAVVKTIKTIAGIQRPTLPARASSGMLSSSSMLKETAPRPDPEGAVNVVETSKEEKELQTKLLQSFVTHMVEEYLLNFEPYDDVPGMAWCSRIMEQAHPERSIPDSKGLAGRFADEEKLHRRIDAVGQLSALSRDLKLTNMGLLDAAITADKVPETAGDEDDPPSSAEDVPLSRLGSLLLFAARQASDLLYDERKSDARPVEIFPDHQELLRNCLAGHGMGMGQLGTEPEALIDSVLALGLVCLERDAIGNPINDEQFNAYLEVTALLSSNCPNASLRGHAHYLTTTILRSQPNEEVRLAFIRDTLEHCPFENLKVSAVGWIKGETVEANPPTPLPGNKLSHDVSVTERRPIFARPHALDSLAPHLFPSLHADLLSAPLTEAWQTFQANASFYLASLNFLFLLLQARHLHSKLAVAELWSNNDIAGSFLQPLRDARARFWKAMDEDSGTELESERSAEGLAELTLLEETIQRVTRSVPNLNEA